MTLADQPAGLFDRNFLITVEYDGTHFQGWQVQPDAPTIQGVLTSAVERMVHHPVTVNGSGRTDAGVHAWGQTASFRCSAKFGPEVFIRGLNSLLPDSVVVVDCREVPLAFHARFSAVSKTYVYRIRNHPVPSALNRLRSWHRPDPLDLADMQRASAHLVGTIDFSSFEAAGSPRASSIRTLTRAEWTRDGDDLLFTLSANGFLRYMVRNILGTLEWVGSGKLSPGDLPGILAAKNRKVAGPTAPAHGLYLKQVDYPPAAFE